MRRGGARPRNVTYQRQLPLQERGQRERSSPGAARDGTGRDGRGGGRHGPSGGTGQGAAGTRRTRTQAGGGAGAEALGGLGVAAEHGVWVLRRTGCSVSGGSASSNPSPRLKIAPRLPTALRPSGLRPAGGRHRTGGHLDRGATSAPAPLAGTQHPQAAGRGRRGARRCWLGAAGVAGRGRGAADHAPSTGTRWHE